MSGRGDDDITDDPMALLASWLEEARVRNIVPEAMALATSTLDGRPSNRFVLLKGVDERGISFFTNYEGRKARELDENPRAAAAIFWQEPRRQARIEGSVEKLTPAESDVYFDTRDRGSQLSAVASPQSCPIEGRVVLEERVVELDAEYRDQAVPRADYWGGYRIRAEVVEFWECRDNRLHDRFRYSLKPKGSWKVERLAP